MSRLINNINNKSYGGHMKRLALFFAFVLFSFSVFAQGEEG
jgi:hypothetical protein